MKFLLNLLTITTCIVSATPIINSVVTATESTNIQDGVNKIEVTNEATVEYFVYNNHETITKIVTIINSSDTFDVQKTNIISVFKTLTVTRTISDKTYDALANQLLLTMIDSKSQFITCDQGQGIEINYNTNNSGIIDLDDFGPQ